MRWFVGAAGLALASGCLRGPITGDGDGGSTSVTTGSLTSTSANPSSSPGNPSTSTTTATTDGVDPGPSDGTTTATGGCPFICESDHPGTINCDLWAQDCPEGEKCMPWANDGGRVWNANKCVPIHPDPKGQYEPCAVEGSPVSGIDDCDIHHMCFYVHPDTLQGVCLSMCIGSEANPQCPNPEEFCSIHDDGTLTLCQRECDPLMSDCPAGMTCNRDFGYRFMCGADHSGSYGDACDYLDSCGPDLFCLEASFVPGCTDTRCCTEFCDLRQADPSSQCTGEPEGAECVAWYWEAPPGYELLGICRLLP